MYGLSEVHGFADGAGQLFPTHVFGVFRDGFIGFQAILDELGVDVARTEVGILEDFLVVVDILQELVEGKDALLEPGFDLLPVASLSAVQASEVLRDISLLPEAP